MFSKFRHKNSEQHKQHYAIGINHEVPRYLTALNRTDFISLFSGIYNLLPSLKSKDRDSQQYKTSDK
jgi:hypothetical protein